MENNPLFTLATKAESLPTKQELAEMVDKFELMFTEPDPTQHVDALKTYLTLKRIETFVADSIKRVAPWALQEAEQYDDKERKCLYNSKVVINPAKPKYNFTSNPEWVEKNVEIESYLREAEAAAKNWNQQASVAKIQLKSIEDTMIAVGTAEIVDKGNRSLSITVL